jgi:DNA polymerase
MTEVLGIRPGGYADTRQMGRALGNGRDSYSLDAMAKRYGLNPKGHQVKTYINKRRADFTPWELADYGKYCGNSYVTGEDGDTDLTWQLFKIFAPLLPAAELEMASMVAKMYAEPRLHLNQPLLRGMLDDLMVRKQATMERVAGILGVNPGLPPDQRILETQRLLRKDAVLADVLKRQYDVEPPMKFSKKQKNDDGSPKAVYAFAKTDEGMEALLEFEDESDPEGAEDIQSLASARLSVKSTIAESRLQRFHGVATRGALPVPLVFGKTHTHRLAGGQKLNMQNLSGTRQINAKTLFGTLIRTPRGIERLYNFNRQTKQIMCQDGMIFDQKDGHGELQVWVCGLRDCIVAPPGMKLVVVDSSQIELRVCHMLAGQLDTVDDLRRGIDVYSSFASSIYQRPITKSDHKERQHGKVGMLQLQYQAGWKSFRNAARVMGGVRLSEDEAQGTVSVYRNRFTEVQKFWRTCQRGIEQMAKGGGRYLDQWGLVRIEHNRLAMNGFAPLDYHNLRQELISFDGEDPQLQWVYDDKELRYAKRIYGGSTTENLCQWIARNIVLSQTAVLESRWGSYERHGEGVVLSVHDEAVLCVREDRAEACLADSLQEFAVPPAWWLQLPVKGEGGIGNTYAECK